MGMTQDEIAEELDIGRTTVLRDLNYLKGLAEKPLKEHLEVDMRRKKQKSG
jgi:hypothetical protein